MPRWLILILLLLNLGLFTWGYLQPQPQEEHLAPSLVELPTIRLLAERDQPQAVAESGVREKPGTETAGSRPGSPLAADSRKTVHNQRQGAFSCLQLGPFEQQSMAAAASDMLGAAGHDTRLQVQIERSKSGYWVLIPPGEEDPDFVIVNLELAGIQDVWRFDKGDLAGAISLGLYSDNTQALVRQRELRDKGFGAEIRPRLAETPRYWIETSFSQDDETAQGAIDQLYVEYHWLRYPPQKCAEVATP
jgi:hypothetical protein